MNWVCTDCRAEYADAPADACTVCGNGTVVPADAVAGGRPFETARGALEGESPESGLRNTSPVVRLTFRLVVLATLAVAAVVGAGLLLRLV